MLQPTEKGCWHCRGCAWSLAALLMLLAVVPNASLRRGFAGDKPSRAPTREAATPKEREAKRPPFDLSYVPPEATAVLAVRPNVLLSDPAMRPLAQMATEALAQRLQSGKVPVDLKLRIEEIEQVVGFMTVTPNKGEPQGVHRSVMGLVMIRTAHEFDWRKLLRQLDPKTETIHRGDQTYYKSNLKLRPQDVQGAPVYSVIPDKRTLVILPSTIGSAIQFGKATPAGKLGQRPRFSWDRDWKQVEHGLIAVAMDNRWARGLSTEQIGGEPDWAALTQKTNTMVAGVDWQDGLLFQAFLACKDEAAAKDAAEAVKAIVTRVRADLEQHHRAGAPPDQAGRIAQRVTKDLLEGVRITRQDTTVCVRTKARVSVLEVVKVLMGRIPPQ